jgi:hypothetical protein
MRCVKHPFDRGQEVCSHCGLVYCERCLVYPAGANKDAFCIQCTVSRAVRVGSQATKPVKRRELKQRRRQLADYLATCPPTFEQFVELAPILDPQDVPADHGEGRPRAVDWCA